MSPEDYICYHTGFIQFMKFDDFKEMRMYHQNSLPVHYISSSICYVNIKTVEKGYDSIDRVNWTGN